MSQELKELIALMGDEIVAQLKGDKGDKGDDGDDGETPSDSKLLSIIDSVFRAHKPDLKGEKGDSVKGDQGDKPKAGVDYKIPQDGKSIVGKPGKMPNHKYEDGKLQFEKPDGTYGKVIDIQKMLEELVKKIKLPKNGILKGFGGVSQTQPVTESLTSQCDGANKAFTTTYNFKSGTIQLQGQDFPFTYDPASDWTENDNNQFTLSAEVDAPLTGQRLIVSYVRS